MRVHAQAPKIMLNKWESEKQFEIDSDIEIEMEISQRSEMLITVRLGIFAFKRDKQVYKFNL